MPFVITAAEINPKIYILSGAAISGYREKTLAASEVNAPGLTVYLNIGQRDKLLTVYDITRGRPTLLVNGTFEAGAGFLTGWTVTTPERVTDETSEVYADLHSCRMVAGSPRSTIAQTVPVSAEAAYVLTFHYYLYNGGVLTVNYWDVTHDETLGTSSTSSEAVGWTLYTEPIGTNAGQTQLKVTIQAEQFTDEDVIIDNVSLVML
jgi:hypothetical protein